MEIPWSSPRGWSQRPRGWDGRCRRAAALGVRHGSLAAQHRLTRKRLCRCAGVQPARREGCGAPAGGRRQEGLQGQSVVIQRDSQAAVKGKVGRGGIKKNPISFLGNLLQEAIAQKCCAEQGCGVHGTVPRVQGHRATPHPRG